MKTSPENEISCLQNHTFREVDISANSTFSSGSEEKTKQSFHLVSRSLSAEMALLGLIRKLMLISVDSHTPESDVTAGSIQLP